MNDVEKGIYLPRNKIDEIKQKRFRAIVKYVYNNCAFYRRLFKESGVDIDSVSLLKTSQTSPSQQSSI